MFEWSADHIRFMKDACEYTDYYARLAAQIGPELPPEAHICDAGCGAGYLALSMLPYAARVTAIDRSAGMLALLREKNSAVQALCGDIWELMPEQPYDAMLCCFFGGTTEALALAKAQCKESGKVFFVRKGWLNRRFVTREETAGSYSVERCVSELDALGIPHKLKLLSLEMGQPFRSFEDALLFFHAYNFTEEPIDEAAIRARLQDDPRGEYMYYMPAKKDVGLFTMNIADIPKDIQRPIKRG